MEARNAAAVTPRQARHRPAELHGTWGLAERIRPVLASLADPAMGVPPEGLARARVDELLAAAAAVLDAAAHAVRHGTPVDLPSGAAAAFKTPDTGAILTGPSYRAAMRLATLLQDVVETVAGEDEPVAAGGAGRLRAVRGPPPTVREPLRPGWEPLRPRCGTLRAAVRGRAAPRPCCVPPSSAWCPSSCVPCATNCTGTPRSAATPPASPPSPRPATSSAPGSRSATATGRPWPP